LVEGVVTVAAVMPQHLRPFALAVLRAMATQK
jgi:hypothetical protein